MAGVTVRSWQLAYRGLFPDDYLDGLRAEDRIAHYTFGDVRPGNPTTVVAVLDTTLCGFAALGPAQDQDAAHASAVYALYVDPPAWGRGIGRSLIAAARTRLSRQGFTESSSAIAAEPTDHTDPSAKPLHYERSPSPTSPTPRSLDVAGSAE